MNYKKSLLSLATCMLLSTTASADTNAKYVPLTSTTADSMWIMFGVSGFSDGTSSTAGGSSAFTLANNTSLEDTTVTDTLATAGLDATGDLASLQALADVSGTTSLSVAVDITGITFSDTEPVRTMYIKVGTATPNVKFNYKASLEGKTMQVLRNGDLYTVTISEDSTYSNAVTASSGSSNSGNANNLTAITDVIDYDTTNNPVTPSAYSKDDHQDTVAETASFYHFNQRTQQWEVWNKNSATNGDDFTEFEKGKAYWGRVDVGDAVGDPLANDTDGASGLVLGKPTPLNGLPDPDMYLDDTNTSILTTGWNMISFDATKPYIRHAATGLITTSTANTDVITITDAAGLNSIAVTLGAGADDEQGWAQEINVAIESAKLLGTLPSTFNLKVFASEVAAANAGGLVFISDAKFSIASDNAAVTVTTLTGGDVYVSGVETDLSGGIGANTATSAYGEYSMIIDLLVSDLADAADTAAALDADASGGGTNVSAKVLFGDASGDNAAIGLVTAAAAALDTDPTAALAKAEIEKDDIFEAVTTPNSKGLVTAIDSDFDGDLDKVILASTVPFYVKDNTFVRVYTWNNTGAGGEEIRVASTATSDIAIAGGAGADTAADVAALIQAQADGGDETGVYAAENAGDTKLIAVSTDNSGFDIKDTASGTLDFLSESTESEAIAKGAIGGAYSLDAVAKLPLIQHKFTSSYAGVAKTNVVAATDEYTVQVNAIAAVSDTDFGAAAVADTAAGRKTFLDNICTTVNTIISTAEIHGYCSHDFDENLGDLTAFRATTITVEGIDITGFTLTAGTVNVNGGNAIPSVPAETATDPETLGTGLDTGDLKADVKANPVYTPNFAKYGPLYTLRDAGYDIRAILKPTTEMDDTTGNIVWDSMDLTRAENEWFANNEFNLFSVNGESGYWSYLETKSSDTVTIGTASLTSPAYTYYFSNTVNADTEYPTTNIMSNGQISVEVTGIDDTVAGSVYAIIDGEEIAMTRTTGTDIFTANVSNYSLKSFTQDQTGPKSVSIRAVNGKGESVKDSSALSIDYKAPEDVTAVANGANSIDLSATGGDVSKFYLFDTYIAESDTASTSGTLKATVSAQTGGTVTYSACPSFTFGTTTALRIVAADGDGGIGTSNISNAIEYNYASALKGAHVLSHTQGVGNKAQIGVVYDSSCVAETTQPTAVTENNGVSLATLVNGGTARLAFVPKENTNFTIDFPFTSNYELPAADGSTRVIQVQNTGVYANDTFYVEYGSKLYSGTFPATQLAADQSISAPIALVAVTSGNTTLLP